MTEIEERADFSRIRYAMCWEDADILVEALRPRGRVCAGIGSAGDNSFSLLAAGAAAVHVAEMNPAQVACIELRRAAYLRLDHAGFLEALGVRGSERRGELYHELRDALPGPARAFWDRRPEILQRGAVSQGKFERYFRLFRTFVLPLAHPGRRVRGLLEPRSGPERERFYETRWNNRRWRMIFRVFFSRFVMGRLGRDPAFFAYVEGSVADRILARVRHALVSLDPSVNPYLRWILTGAFGDHLPHAYREEHFEAVAAALREGRLHVHEGPIETMIPGDDPLRFDAFNLSDIFEYMSPDNTAVLLRRLAAAARPGARFAYWNMLAPRSRPESLAHALRPLDGEAARLFARDQTFFYSRFVVEERV